MKQHITILGALYIAFNIHAVLAGMIVLVATTGGGLLSGDPEAIAITSTVGIAVASLLFVLSVPGIICGIGLLRRQAWARILGLILGCVNLFSIPFGTALGIYTIYILIQEEAAAYFSDVSDPGTRAAS